MKFLLLPVFTLSLQLSFAATYYFSSVSGDDSRSQEEAQMPLTPWKTLDKLNSLIPMLKAGDSVFFKRGETYFGTVRVNSSGSTGNAIFYGAYGTGANPVITGLTTLSDWTLYSPGIYSAPLEATKLNLITVDGQARTVGRFPNAGYLKYENHVNNESITDNELTGTPDWTGAEIVVRKYRFVLDRHLVTSQAGSTLNYSTSTENGNNSAYKPVNGNGYFFQNHLQTLDQFGEWYFDRVNKRLYVFFGSNAPGNYTVKASVTDNNMQVSTVHDLVFDQLDFEGANTNGLSLVNSSNIVVRNCNFHNQGGRALYGIDLNSILVSGGSIQTSFSNGIFFEYNANNCTINGVSVTNTNTQPGTGRSGDAVGIGIMVYGNQTVISNCKVVNSGYNGIQFIGNNVLVEKNYVDSFCLVKDDGGGIYTYTGSPGVLNENRKIRNNIVLNAIGAYAGVEAYSYEPFGEAAGIYLDEYASNVEVTGNTLAHGDWAGIMLHDVQSNLIQGNIIYDHRFQVQVSQSTTATRNLTVNDNQFIGKQTFQKTFYYRSYAADDPSTMGVFDYNYFARPLDDNKTIQLDNYWTGGNGTNFITLSQWQSSYSLDQHSQKSPLTYSSNIDDNLRLEYNSGNTVKIVNLPASYVDVKNNQYAGSIGLEPFTGVVLFKSPVNFLLNQVITFPSIADQPFSGSPVLLNATSTSGLPVTYRVVSGPATVTGNTLTLTGTGTVTVEAAQAGNASYKPAKAVTQSFLISLAGQSILFPAIAEKKFGDPAFALEATSSSGLPVRYTIVSGPATVNNNMLTINGAGVLVIEAAQDGNGNFLPAASVQQSVSIGKGTADVQISGYNAPYDGLAHGAAVASVRDAYGNALPADLVTFSDNSYTDVPGGTANWRFAGDENHQPSSGTANIVITKAGNTLYFEPIPEKTYGDLPFALGASSSSGLPVTFAVSSGPALLNGSSITITGAGTVTVQAAQAGNENYLAAATVSQSFVVQKAAQTINFTAVGDKTFGDPPFSLTATTTVGLPVSFRVVSGPATLSGNTVTLTGGGTVTIEATQAGNMNYNAAAPVQQSFVVAKKPQTITFNALANKTYGNPPFSISATASSGLTVSFRVVDGPASVSGSTVTLKGAGTVTIEASQAGNATYQSAPVVSQSFDVAKASQTISFPTISNKTFGTAPFNLTATASSGLPVSYRVVSGPATVSGNTVTLTGAGSVTIEAAQAGSANYNAAATVQKSFSVAKANQTITFPSISSKTYGTAPFAVNATASSGLPVSFSVTSGPAKISGNIVTLTGTGKVTIKATQAGDLNYNAASPVQQSFNVTKPSNRATTTQTNSDGGVKESLVSDEQTRLSIYPNPVVGQSIVRIDVPETSTGSLNLYNSEGKMVRQWPLLRIEKGLPAFIQLQGKGLSKGSYFLRFTGGDKVIVRILMIL